MNESKIQKTISKTYWPTGYLQRRKIKSFSRHETQAKAPRLSQIQKKNKGDDSSEGSEEEVKFEARDEMDYSQLDNSLFDSE